jgi:hypothetical protein
MLQQAIRKSARRCADVQGYFSLYVNLKLLESFRQLGSAAADIERGSGLESYCRAGINEASRFGNRPVVNQHLAGQDPRPPGFAARYQTAPQQ